ncbi:CDGSH iron-sulfur domain-containing protein [Carboxydochorda subterranea]|uniref:CDGSH iron-sulfur domain-containing protein n=1 Tax=Carboxydichorda subterranea TaxID=3109565 RepID=A0ABZ1C3B6_9FIRM|nr:CDGSH iron-sulfur domain-containing protein [Limnochorda sp. L945t]WRP18652.1 CDGSH iron-sulfur domain-containing protein [Limnochorda sp. L945t]
MASYTTEERNGHPRTTVKLEPGERVALCRCFQSKKFPLCDGTHRDVPGKGPVIVEAPGEPPAAKEG